jgi:hypothetical protein
MSVASFGLESLNLDIDEDFLYSIPNIQLNKGGQIINIVQGDIENNVSVETAVVLQECTDVITPLEVALNNLSDQVGEIAIETNSLENGVATLTANVTTLVDNINTLITEIDAQAGGAEVIVNNITGVTMNTLIGQISGIYGYWERRRKIPIHTQSLSAGVYIANFNWIIQSSDILDGQDVNTDTRYKITMAYAENSSTGDYLATSINNCSGHNGLNISHSSSFCFDLTTDTSVQFGIWYDIACTTYTDGTALIYGFNDDDQQTQMYPLLNNINTEVLQVIKLG